MTTAKQAHDSTDARLRRIETMLYLLCLHLGLEPRTNTKLATNLTNNTHEPR